MIAVGRRFLRWFVPNELQADTEEHRNAIRSVVFGLAMVFWAPVFAPIYYALGSPRAATMIVLAGTAIAVSMISLRITKSAYFVGTFIATVVFAVLIGLACVTGGIESVSLWWLPSVPIIALVLCGIRAGIVWALASCLACTVFFAFAKFDVAFPNDIAAEHRQFLVWSAVCGIVLCAFTLTLAFKLGETAARSELEAARDASDQANRAKALFLANMSHEIRTPMNAIIGMTELVLGMKLDPDQREHLRVVQTSSESLLALINDILDFSKIEAGKLELDRESFDLHQMLGDTMKTLGFQAHKRGLELICDIKMDVPRIVVGDQRRLRQVIVNLVDNALKFTEHGEVVLKVECRRKSDEAVSLRFSVTDTGIGIPTDKREVIFDKFSQADMTSTRRYGGTGLGLAISSQLVQMMEGQIGVKSEVGCGSTFHFTARFGLADHVTPYASVLRRTGLHKPRALVVDDNATNRGMLEGTLRSWDIAPIAVADVRQAMVLIRQVQKNGTPFHLILADANVPGIDEFLLAGQAERGTELRCPVVMMLAARGRSSETVVLQQPGITLNLPKPVTPVDLFNAVQAALRETTQEIAAANTPGQESPGRRESLKILVVEDSLVNQKLAVALLQKAGHEVLVANNGREALETLEGGAFDLILMDVQMPEMDGVEATRAIRGEEEITGRHIPIIAMTAHALEGDRELFLSAGMDHYIAKPIRAKALLETIEAAIESLSSISFETAQG